MAVISALKIHVCGHDWGANIAPVFCMRHDIRSTNLGGGEKEERKSGRQRKEEEEDGGYFDVLSLTISAVPFVGGPGGMEVWAKYYPQQMINR